MSPILMISAIILIIWVAVRTLSFAAWNWRHGNKVGSVMVALISLATVALPAYIIFFKR